MKKHIETIRLNSGYAITAAMARVERLPQENPDVEWEMVLRPYRFEKTGQQRRTIHMWFRDASATDVNEFAGHSEEWWKNEFKIKHLLPALLATADEDGDIEFPAIVGKWREIYGHARPQDKPYLRQVLAENEALSTEKASRTELSIAMESFVRWCALKGILLTIPEQNND